MEKQLTRSQKKLLDAMREGELVLMYDRVTGRIKLVTKDYKGNRRVNFETYLAIKSQLVSFKTCWSPSIDTYRAAALLAAKGGAG